MIKEYAELDAKQQAQVAIRFSATPLFGKSFADYVYEITESGTVLSRKSRAEHERETAMLVKPEGNAVEIDGWFV